MQLECPDCDSVYQVPSDAIGAAGRHVICPRCQATWFAAGDPAPVDAAEILTDAVSERVLPPSYEAVYGTTPAPSVRQSRFHPSRLPLGPLCAAALVAAAMASLAFRNEIVRVLPRANAAYAALGLPVNLRGVALANVQAQLQAVGGAPVLEVQADIANLRRGNTGLAEMEVSLQDAQGAQIYAWRTAPPKPKLDGGETVAFRARLNAPPAAARHVVVRFASAGSGQ